MKKTEHLSMKKQEMFTKKDKAAQARISQSKREQL